MRLVNALMGIMFLCTCMVQVAHGRANLWLFPHDSAALALTDYYYTDLNYNNDDDPYEPMLTESFVVIGPAYVLDVYNHGKESCRDTQLVVSVNDIARLTSITIDGNTFVPADFALGTPTFHSGKEMPPHGVFPTHYMKYPLGRIESKDMVQLSISVVGDVGLKVHYDAYGMSGTGRKTYDVFNPFSHDFTGIHYGHEIEFNKSDVMIQDWEGMPPSTYLPPFNNLPTPFNPVIDAAFSFPAEWHYASVRTNLTNSGSIYRQNQLNWVATSVQTGSQTMYPGITLFDLHNFWAATTQEPADYNIFSMPYAGHTVTAWVFMPGDEADDSFWLPHAQGLALSHLIPEGAGSNQIVDEGFIVRLDGDPTTDRHWFPGSPEPGDPNWNWLNWYGYFGRAGYNDSGWQSGTYCTAPGTHEVYEMAFHPPFVDDGIPPPPPTLQRCYTIEWVPTYSDPHNGSPQQYMPVIVLLGPGHVDRPLSPPPPPPPGVPWPPDPPYYETAPEEDALWIEVLGEPIAVEGQTLTLAVLGGNVWNGSGPPVTLLATFTTEQYGVPPALDGEPPPSPIADFEDFGNGMGVFTFTPPAGTAGSVFEVKFKAVNPLFQNGLWLRIPIMPSVWGP